MSSIAKTSISISKKDLAKSRIPPVGVRNVVFYHKATAGDLTIDLLSLVLPSVEMPTVVQATPDEISGARLSVNKKNLSLVSSYKGPLIQGLDYIVVDSSTIRLIGAFESVGAEPEEIFVGTINGGGVSDLVVASSRNVVRTYELPVGQSTLNIANEFKVNMYPSENVGIIKVFVNGVLAFRNTGNSSVVLDRDYYEVDSGNGFGTSIVFNVAPVSLPYQIVVDFGVQAVTDFDAIGTIESLSGSVKKIADDLAVVAGTDTNDYLMANPSDVERRGFGDKVLNLDSKYDTIQNLSTYTKTKFQIKRLTSNVTAVPSGTATMTEIGFNNLEIGKKYKISFNVLLTQPGGGGCSVTISNGVTTIGTVRRFVGASSNSTHAFSRIITATASTIAFVITDVSTSNATAEAAIEYCFSTVEELPNHEETTQWT